jgi:hypothetical protein
MLNFWHCNGKSKQRISCIVRDTADLLDSWEPSDKLILNVVYPFRDVPEIERHVTFDWSRTDALTRRRADAPTQRVFPPLRYLPLTVLAGVSIRSSTLLRPELSDYGPELAEL